jgi:hypothetical protein
MNKSNGQQKPKTDVALGQSKRLRLLKDAIIGTNDYGKYYLYQVVTEQGIEESFFAPEPIHNIIQENKLKTGDEFILSRVQNGKPGSSKLELSLVSVAEQTPKTSQTDGLKEILLQCVKDAAEVIRSSGVQLGNDELQKLATTLFIQRAKNV